MSALISSLGERDLIERIRQRLTTPVPDFVRLGIGDDAAVLRADRGADDVITTDALVEGVHFRRDWTSLRAIGHKALAVNLSDLAAMGAVPRAALVSLILPAELPLDGFDDLITGLVGLAAATKTTIVGGNIARSSGPLVIDVTAIGSVRPRRLLRRAGARAGHRLYVTGTVGSAAAGLGMLASGRERSAFNEEQLACIDRHERPEPRLRFAGIVAKTAAAAACIDLSDGLADAATRLASAANLGVIVDGSAVPVTAAATSWFAAAGGNPVRAAISGGEDYELAFAVAPRQERRFQAAARRCPDLTVHRVGVFTPEPGAWLDLDGVKEPLGQPEFEHF